MARRNNSAPRPARCAPRFLKEGEKLWGSLVVPEDRKLGSGDASWSSLSWCKLTGVSKNPQQISLHDISKMGTSESLWSVSTISWLLLRDWHHQMEGRAMKRAVVR